jgi:hypothetical protein
MKITFIILTLKMINFLFIFLHFYKSYIYEITYHRYVKTNLIIFKNNNVLKLR